VDSGLIVPFGRYVLKERLAQGGMGEVFRAVAVGEHGFEKPVVVKRVLPAHAGREDLTELFVAEAKLMTRLSHPNIVEVLDFGRGEHKDYYLVLELVDGTDLGRLLRAYQGRDEPFPVPLALFIASQVLRGLHHAHTKSAGEGGVVVHRDVSPSNVLCGTEGEVKVADFGVALVTHVDSGRDRAGVAGKPGYMAPEQFDGGAVDPRADVFSAGVVLQQILTGEMPFAGDTAEAQQDAARRGERKQARARREDVSEAVEAILAKALAPDPGERFADARSMAQAIERLRDTGQAIAGGDDVAEAVRAAQRELPALGRKVIALSRASATAEPEEAAPDESPRELTRTGAPGGVGAFTLRFPVRADATTRQRDEEAGAEPRVPDRWSTPEPRTERIQPEALLETQAEAEPGRGDPASAPYPAVHVPSGEVPEAPRPRPVRWTAGAAVLAAAVLGLMAFAVRAPARDEGWVPPPPALGAVPVPSAAVTAATVAPSATSETSATAVPAAATASAVAPAAAAPRVSARVSAERPPVSAAPAVVAPECTGAVAFFSDGSWTITGGPRAVQSPSPGEVWACGTYSLVARSRHDPTQVKTAQVTVSPLGHATVDLR
jgi:hypothetical protein